MRLTFILPFVVFIIAFSSCKKDNTTSLKSLYDLDAPLAGAGQYATSTGFIKFRQNPDMFRLISLETRVTNLLPNHAYQLQRAVNPIADVTGCSSNIWLTLGDGLLPKSILTDAQGNGNADLWREITAIARGTAFHIRFQIVDVATSTPVLKSNCFDYTVR